MPRRPLEPESDGARIVREEQLLLGRVEVAVGRKGSAQQPQGPATDYDAVLIELRDALAEAKPEDIPPLVEQMARVAALAGHHLGGLHLPVDPESPYFAHLRLREPPHGAQSRVRDVLIGRRGFIDRAAGVQIVDWRDAPVSQIYYRYDEADDYEEVLADRRVEGVVEARRNLNIAGGKLTRIGCPQGVFVQAPDGRWYAAEGVVEPTLEGGQGKAARPPRPELPRRGPRRRLGVQTGPVPRADKHLPEIAALIDTAQFELITAPGTGLVVIEGGAGSGKTTVALHRVAYLAFHDPQRFRPSRCLVVVPSTALERYVAGVLPALGVRGVPVVSFPRWARQTRRRVVPELPDRYTEETPPAVLRVKKHPGLLPLLAATVAERARAAGAEVAKAALGAEARASVSWAWEDLRDRPPVPRLQALLRWARSAPLDAAERQRIEIAIGRVLRRTRDVVTAWAELLTDATRLREALPREGSDAVSDQDIADLVRWAVAQQEESAEEELKDVDPEARAPVDGGMLDESAHGRAAGRLDAEDDALLLRLAQLLYGGLVREGPVGGQGPAPSLNRPIRYDHIAVDEAQDLAAVEIKVLLDAAAPHEGPDGARSISVTLAGDVAQRLVFDNAFRGWQELLADLGLAEVETQPLTVSYRSTQPVMQLARAVLGPLAPPTAPPARPGAPVELHRFPTMGEAVGFLASALRSLMGREPTASVALVSRFPSQADAWYGALARAEVPGLRRVSREEFPFTPGIDVTDVAQVKGLEFDYVVLLDVTTASYPDGIEARHLLHIGATRAIHQLWLISVGDPSPLIPRELLEAGE
jgi:DNA helicase-2/ATP-dependent DNA helicase PcrA